MLELHVQGSACGSSSMKGTTIYPEMTITVMMTMTMMIASPTRSTYQTGQGPDDNNNHKVHLSNRLKSKQSYLTYCFRNILPRADLLKQHQNWLCFESLLTALFIGGEVRRASPRCHLVSWTRRPLWEGLLTSIPINRPVSNG